MHEPTPDVACDDLGPLKKTLATEGNSVLVSIANSGKVRRNGPCPCGSGVKFKKCHLGGVRDGELDRLKAARPR